MISRPVERWTIRYVDRQDEPPGLVVTRARHAETGVCTGIHTWPADTMADARNIITREITQ